MHESHYIHEEAPNFLMLISMSFPFVLGIILYAITVYYSNRKYQVWPIHRIVCWIIGIGCIALALIGPIAELAHFNFQYHMYTPLLLGMLGPL